MFRQLVALCLLYAIAVASGVRKPQDRVLAQLPVLRKMYDKAIKTIDDEATLNGDEYKQLQASANNFQLYIQEAVYVLNEAADKVVNPNYKKQFGTLLNIVQDVTYGIGKNINGNAARTKPVIKNMLNSYVRLFSASKNLFELPENEKIQFAMKFAEEVYNLGAFNVCLIYVELQYRKKTNLQIGNQIQVILDEASVMLKKIDAADLSQELVALMRFLKHLTDRIVVIGERWAYIYKNKNPQVDVIANVTQRLASDAWNLRRSARASETTLYLRQILEGYLNNVSKELKKLAVLDTAGLRHENDICKDILLEYLTVVHILPIELQVLIALKNN